MRSEIIHYTEKTLSPQNDIFGGTSGLWAQVIFSCALKLN